MTCLHCDGAIDGQTALTTANLIPRSAAVEVVLRLAVRSATGQFSGLLGSNVIDRLQSRLLPTKLSAVPRSDKQGRYNRSCNIPPTAVATILRLGLLHRCSTWAIIHGLPPRGTARKLTITRQYDILAEAKVRS